MSGGGPSLAIELALESAARWRIPVRAKKIRLQAAPRPPQRQTEDAPAATPGGAAVEDAVRLILRHIGEDPEREGLKLTPNRVLHALEFLTRGYKEDPKVAINGAVFSRKSTRRSSCARTSTSTPCASITCCPSSARHTWPTCLTGASSGSRARPPGRDLRAPPASPGAAHHADRAHPDGRDRAIGGRRRARGRAYAVYANARGRKSRTPMSQLRRCSECSAPISRPGRSS